MCCGTFLAFTLEGSVMKAIIQNTAVARGNISFSCKTMRMASTAIFAVGLVFFISGLMLWAVSSVEDLVLHGMDAMMLAASLGLFFIGAHWLDRAEREELSKRK